MAPDTADLSVRLSVESERDREPRGQTGLAQRRVETVVGMKCCIGLTQIVPHIHLAAQRADLDDGLTQEVVGLPLELLLHARLDVVVLVPHSHFDAVRGVVALAGGTEKHESAKATKRSAPNNHND